MKKIKQKKSDSITSKTKKLFISKKLALKVKSIILQTIINKI